MKIEPGTLCLVRSVVNDPELRGRLVVARWRSHSTDRFSSIDGKIHCDGDYRDAWACMSPQQRGLLTATVSRSVRNIFGRVRRSEIVALFRAVPISAQFLQPISGPSIDTSETGDKSLEAARAMGDNTWQTGAVWL